MMVNTLRNKNSKTVNEKKKESSWEGSFFNKSKSERVLSNDFAVYLLLLETNFDFIFLTEYICNNFTQSSIALSQVKIQHLVQNAKKKTKLFFI